MPLAYSAPSRRDDAAFAAWATRYQRMAVSPGRMDEVTGLVMATDVRSALPVLRGPVLVLHTSENRFLAVEHGRYLADHIEGASSWSCPAPITSPGSVPVSNVSSTRSSASSPVI